MEEIKNILNMKLIFKNNYLNFIWWVLNDKNYQSIAIS